MQVIARDLDDLAGPNHEVVCILTLDSNMESALNDIVKDD